MSAWADEPPVKEPLPSETVQKALGSALDSVGSFFKKAAAPANAASEVGDVKDGMSTASANTSTPMNVIDITQINPTANVVLDPLCNTPVEPFGITDNAGSLLLLAGKLKLLALTNSLQPGTTQNMRTSDVIKMAARGLNWLPMDLEIKLGDLLLEDADILDEHKNRDAERTYRNARKVLDEIVSALPKPLPYQFRILVTKASRRSSSALPGGIVLVDRDLFDPDVDPDYTYFVIAHEVAHVLQRHQTRAYQARLVDGIDSLDGLRKLIGASGQSTPTSVLAYATSLKKLVVDFSEQQELQADSCAVRWIAQRHGDARKQDFVLQKIAQQLGPVDAASKGGAQSGKTVVEAIKYLGDGVFESHPNSLERKNNLKKTLDAQRSAPAR
jgi:Zn-dependent protease with chaperone function